MLEAFSSASLMHLCSGKRCNLAPALTIAIAAWATVSKPAARKIVPKPIAAKSRTTIQTAFHFSARLAAAPRLEAQFPESGIALPLGIYCLCDQDDIWLSDKLETAASHLNKHRCMLQNGLTCDPARGRSSLANKRGAPGRDHLVTGGAASSRDPWAQSSRYRRAASAVGERLQEICQLRVAMRRHELFSLGV